MKKILILMAAACCLSFTACNNNKPAEQPKECPEMQAEEHPCCKDMTSEQKAEMEAHKQAMEDWKNWENITEERRVELLNERKADYDKMMEMKKAQEEKRAKFEAAMNNWDKLTTAEKKAAFDEMGCCGGCKGEPKGCCPEGGKPGCHKGGPHHGPQGPCPKDHKCPKGEPKR